jgi:hypothetical protein
MMRRSLRTIHAPARAWAGSWAAGYTRAAHTAGTALWRSRSSLLCTPPSIAVCAGLGAAAVASMTAVATATAATAAADAGSHLAPGQECVVVCEVGWPSFLCFCTARPTDLLPLLLSPCACQAVCRAGKAMDAPTVGHLAPRDKVIVVESATVGMGGRLRVKVASTSDGGLQGWLSAVSGSGVRLLTTAVPPLVGKPPSATIRMYSMPKRCQWCTRAKELLAAKVPQPPHSLQRAIDRETSARIGLGCPSTTAQNPLIDHRA